MHSYLLEEVDDHQVDDDRLMTRKSRGSKGKFLLSLRFEVKAKEEKEETGFEKSACSEDRASVAVARLQWP